MDSFERLKLCLSILKSISIFCKMHQDSISFYTEVTLLQYLPQQVFKFQFPLKFIEDVVSSLDVVTSSTHACKFVWNFWKWPLWNWQWHAVLKWYRTYYFMVHSFCRFFIPSCVHIFIDPHFFTYREALELANLDSNSVRDRSWLQTRPKLFQDICNDSDHN